MPAPLHRPPSPLELDVARRSARALADAVAGARQKAGDGALVLGWLGDLHVHALRDYPSLGAYADRIDANSNVIRAFAELSELAPDITVFGGDIADSGCGGEAPHDEYAEFQRLWSASLPAHLRTLPVLGNHDHADTDMTPGLHDALCRHGRPDWPRSEGSLDFYYESRQLGWRFIALDSRQGHPIGPHQIAWLDARMSADPHTPTVLLVHRPWVTVGNWVDDHRQHTRHALDAVDRWKAIRVVISGHTHKSAVWSYRGRTHIVFPSVAYGIGEPCGWGAIVLGRSDIDSVFVKELAGATFDHPSDSTSTMAGGFRVVVQQTYVRSPLFNPCLLPY